MNKSFRILLAGLFLAAAAILSSVSTKTASAAPIVNLPVTLEQPDGEILHLFATGDEFYHWVHDAQGYTIVQDPTTGYFVYANVENDQLVPTQYIVNRVDPASVGLTPNLNISYNKMAEMRQKKYQEKQATDKVQASTSSGTVTNIVVFVRFSDAAEFTDPVSKYNAIFNDTTPGANSLINFYRENSYNALTINTSYFPTPGATVVSFQDSHPRSYYQPYNAVTNPGGYTDQDQAAREHALFRDAINYVDGLGQFPDGATIDSDNNGYVDCITFIINGQEDGWGDLLWPHQWNLFTYNATISGKTVDRYMMVFGDTVQNGVVSHELGHLLIGAPDLYHYYTSNINPSLSWDLMSAGWGTPQHMTCYIKFRYANWLSSIPLITSPGTYTLNPMTSSSGQCYKIASPNSNTEFFIVEYRDRSSSNFEAMVPGSGMIVYRINTAADGMGNGVGPIDELYVYRPGGTTAADGDIYNAHFSSDVGRTAINDGTDPRPFLADGSSGGLSICRVGSASSTISFDYGNCSSFSDTETHWATTYIERLYASGITSGCGSGLYCPDSSVTRGQMAVFLEKGIHGAGFVPTDVAPSFNDTAGHWAEDWIEALKTDGVTYGCLVGYYCPEGAVTRAQMAVFLLKATHGAAYTPPAVGADTGFTDVAIDYWAAAWIKQLAAEGITGGCGTGLYCPENSVTRGEMAVFLVKAFSLP